MWCSEQALADKHGKMLDTGSAYEWMDGYGPELTAITYFSRNVDLASCQLAVSEQQPRLRRPAPRSNILSPTVEKIRRSQKFEHIAAMNVSMADFPTLSPTSEVIFTTQGRISRWSNTGVPLDGCAAIVVPSTEQDIAAVVGFAAQNDLTILPTAGKHGNFLPIDQRSIYLDLKNFGSVELDEAQGCVEIGGGIVAGHLCRTLAERGWYTSMLRLSASRSV